MILSMEAVGSSETSVPVYQIIKCHICQPSVFTFVLLHYEKSLMKYIAYLETKLCPCLIKYCHEDTWESEGIAPPFLTLTLDGGELSASLLCRFIPGERNTGYPLDRRRSAD
jgi:hypothetical protein